jgi:2-phospho-L-lactate guanylyltransferase
VPAARHADLALAMVRDTATAVLAGSRVGELVVVTDDPAVAAAVRSIGARVVPDRPAADLNAAMRFGADEVAGLSRYRAVLAGDLPALRPGQLDEALSAAGGRSFVADAAGTGTVLLAVPPGEPLNPRFGIGSSTAHERSGARPLTGDWPGLRQDVDTPADLAAVVALGAGPSTCELLRDLGLTADCAPAA